VVALLGPRQSGKTTLARQMMPPGHPQYFDLEDPVITDTALDELWVVYPGTRSYALDDRITVRPLHDCLAPR